MPSIQGQKAYALSGVLRDQDDQDEYSPPEFGIPCDLLPAEELQPSFFIPNFLRPLPEEEEDENQPFFDDLSDGMWLVPGMIPEPYWDFNMGMDFNQYKIK